MTLALFLGDEKRKKITNCLMQAESISCHDSMNRVNDKNDIDNDYTSTVILYKQGAKSKDRLLV